MEILGKKKEGISLQYIVSIVFSVIMLVVCIIFLHSNSLFIIITVLLVGIIALVSIVLAGYLKAPKECIKYDGAYTLYVNDAKIDIVNIVDVSYKNNTTRYGMLEHGSVTIKTKTQTHTAIYVDNCENVCKVITKLVYDKQNELKNQ